MGFVKRTASFLGGTAAGVAAGALAGLLFAPESGHDLQKNLRQRIQRAKIAGAEAKADRQTELIRRFRNEVDDSRALTGAEERIRAERDEAIRAVALTLNAPGAIAEQERQALT